ncbi:MAG: hypothetical protein IAB99_00030 [Bacteroidetes bacterium]|uniref:Uncharacterized protein n=1 Tax=Candidatus Cryptobacteroides faecipullorum TaxID=2840764 RepID=A0A9D9I539_9BACT|nr:hypothetical protein [Candidatus Cryptobacteroides faecipullorum]
MLENIRKDIERLVAAYEAEKELRKNLEEELRHCKDEIETYRKQIAELDRLTDNLKLKNAFAGASGDDQARSRIERMIKDIDRCISLMEK